MAQYILRRLLLMIPVFIGVTIMTFAIANILPGDPARSAAGQYATKEQITAVRQRLGLDQPLPVQYLRYMQRLARGDLGDSLTSRQSIAKELGTYLPATLELTGAAMLLTILIGIPLGVITGSTRSPWLKNAAMFTSLAAVGLPTFWAGLAFQLIFFGRLHWLPLAGRLSSQLVAPPAVTRLYTLDALLAGQWSTFADACAHLVLPSVTLAIGSIAAIARITHASMVAVLRKDYIRTARAKGIKDGAVLMRHALKNALLPVVTMLAMQAGWLMGGALLVENIFSWGGLGTYAWVGIFRNDIPVIMAITLVVTVVFMVLNLLTDLSYAWLDPRIRYQ